MKIRSLGLYLFVALGAAACTSPVKPAGTITVATAGPVSPANGALVPNLQQPVTLTATNAFVTDGAASVTYTFEVATDAGFANKVATKDVPQGSGVTSLTLDAMTPGRDYFWHVRATAANTIGAFSGASKFTIGQAIILAAPGIIAPANGASAFGWPTLTVSNAARTGPVGSMVYRFEISTSASFSPLTQSATVSEGSTQTSFTSSAALPPQMTTYFWRATAIDSASAISGPASAAQTFTVTINPLWPGVVPPGTNGKSQRGDNWQEQDLVSFGGVKFHSPTLEMSRLFDLFDKGYEPQAAIDWMHANGYPTEAAWFPAVQVIGVQYVYLALIQGRWHVVLRSE